MTIEAVMKIGKTHIDVFYGDIAALNVEAVVNPANNMLWIGGGFSGIIRKNGGKSIETEALALAPADIGSAVVTGAGDLKARWVIHAVVSGQDLVVHEESIRKTMGACYSKANEIGCTSIALPMLNARTLDVEIHKAAHLMIEETINYLVNENKTLVSVVFVEYPEEMKDIFKTTLRGMFSHHG
ncbi:macro domain-containing protein [Candidatus Latescibacterota bacterium]